MTKELEMTNIEYLKEHIAQLKEVLFVDDLQPALVESVENELKYWKNILNDLTELQAIKEAKPSEAMESLEYIEQKLGGLKYECERTKNHRCDDLFIQEHIFTTIKQALLKAEKLEKAWEIVKEKNVDVYLVRVSKNAEFYNKTVARKGNIYMFDLTEEEFELLKEMIE